MRAASTICRPFMPPGSPTSVISRSMRTSDCRILRPVALSAASSDEYLHVEPVTALRGGVGGGILLRQDNIDVHAGYQHHFSAGFDNGGNGALRAPAGTRSGEDEPFRIGGPLGENEFRSYHTINGGKLVQSANVFDVGVTVHF